MKIEFCEFPFSGIYMERDRVVIQYSYLKALPTFKRLATLSERMLTLVYVITKRKHSRYRHCEVRSNLHSFEDKTSSLQQDRLLRQNTGARNDAS